VISPLFQVTGKEAKHFLPALVAINEEALRANPGWPSVRGLITQGKVKYRLADEQEHWQTYRELVEAVSKQGIAYADCEDLASAVAAEDRVRRGVMTESYAYNPSPNLFHVVAAVPTGSTNKVGALPTARGTLRPGFVLQDPSAAAGMGGDPTKPASFGNDGGTVEKHRPGLVKAFRHGLLPSSGVQLAAELGAGVRKGVGEALGPTSASDLGWMAGRAMLSPLNPQEIMEEDFSMEADLDGFEDLEDDDLLFEDEDALFYDDLQAFDEEEAFAEGYGSLGSTHYGSDENDLASFSAQLGGISTEIHIAKPQLQAKLEALVRAAQAKLEAGKSRAAKLLMAKVSLVLRKAKSLRTKLDLSGRALRLLSWYQDEHSASINLGPVSTTVSLAAREGGSDRRSGRRENRGERRGDRRDNRKDRREDRSDDNSDEDDLASFSAQLGGISTEIHIAKPQLQAKLEALVRAAQAKLEAGKSRAAKLLMAKVSLVLRKAKSLRTKLDLSGRALRLLSWYQDEHSASINLGPVSTTVSLAAREGGSDRRSGRRENRGERRGDRRDNRKDRHAFAEGFGSLSRYGEDPSVFEQNVAWYESTLEEGDMLEAVSKKEGQPDNRHNRRLERSLRRKGLKVVHDVDDVQAAIEEDAFAEGFGSLSRYGEDPSVFEQAVAASLHPIPTAEEAAESYMDWARHGWVTAANRNTPETWSSGVDPETGLVWSLGVGDSLTFEPEMRKLLADAAKRAVVLIRAQGGKVSEPTVVSLPDGAGKAVRVSSSDLLRSATHPLIAMKELAKARGSQLESIARELGKGANVVLQTRHAGGAFTGIYDLYFVDEGTRNKKAAAVRSQDPTHTWVYGNREPGPKTALFYGASKDAVQRAVANCPADASDQYIDEVVAGEIRAECGDLESFGVNPDRRLSRLTHGAQAAKSGGDDVKAKALLMQAEKILAASQEAPSVELRKLLRWSRGQSPSAHAQARKPDHLRSPTLRKAPVFGWTGVVD